MRTEFLQDIGGTLTHKKYLDNVQAIPSLATIVITTSGGADMPIPVIGAACSIDGYGTMSFAVVAGNCTDLGLTFIATWTFTISGVSYTERTYFDVVKNKLEIIITDDDLEKEYAALRDLKYREAGIISELSTSTLGNEIIDSQSFKGTPIYKGGYIKILSGACQNYTAKIIDYDSETGIFELSKILPGIPAIGDDFIVYKSYTDEIERAFEEITDWLRNAGHRPALIIDDTQIREIHINLAISKVLMNAGTQYQAAQQSFYNKYLSLRGELKLDYDTDETGLTDDLDSISGQVFFRR